MSENKIVYNMDLYERDKRVVTSATDIGMGYGSCETAAETTAKVVTLSGYKRSDGGIVVVKFTNAVPASATLNINNEGAAAIHYKGSPITNYVIPANAVVTLVYTGSVYEILSMNTGLSGDPVISTEQPTYACLWFKTTV